MIDYTKPVEAFDPEDESLPPCPVRILCTDAPNSRHPVVAVLDQCTFAQHFTLDGVSNRENRRLRNVPAEPPKPVRHEAWVNLYSDGPICEYKNREAADRRAGERRVECRHIVWNSDGSPVEGEAERMFVGVELMRSRIITLEAERGSLQQQCLDWAATATRQAEEIDSLKAEVERLDVLYHDQICAVIRMKPVVDAAVEWANDPEYIRSHPLVDAVRAYQSQQADPTIDLEGRYTGDIAAAVKRIVRTDKAEPVKHCQTCKYYDAPLCAKGLLQHCAGTHSPPFHHWERKL